MTCLKIFKALWIFFLVLLFAEWLRTDIKNWNCDFEGPSPFNGRYYKATKCTKTEDWLGFIYGWMITQQIYQVLNFVTLIVLIKALYRISTLIKKLEHFGYMHNGLVIRLHIAYCFFTGIYSLYAASFENIFLFKSIKGFKIEGSEDEYGYRIDAGYIRWAFIL